MDSDPSDWKIRFEAELSQALSARAAGNEGRARVCARRAMGVVIEQYLRSRAIPFLRASAYTLLRDFKNLEGLSAEAKEIARHASLRITPDHQLPVQADLIEGARRLAKELLGSDYEQ